MKLGGLGAAGRDLRSALEGRALVSLSDGELLARFVQGRGDAQAEAAFETLIARHGPMVWGTCRRILRDPHAAEDAFQATFLILVKKAASVKVEGSLGRWLHGVGVRVALRARADRARATRDLTGIDPATSKVEPEDLKAVIDEEVERLPSRYRKVVVLCHLEGLTRENAASRLSCPVGTVNSRLSRAGEILRARLTRRGVAPASGGLAYYLAGAEVSAAVPTRLVGSTVAAALRMASGLTLAGLLPAGATVLVHETLRRMGIMTLMKTAAMGSICLGLAAFGLGSMGQEPAKQVPTRPGKSVDASVVPASTAPKRPTLAEQAKAIETEWMAAIAKWSEEYKKGKTEAEREAINEKFYPNEMDYFRRALDLAETDPRDVGARDAWVWVVSEGMRNDDIVEPRSTLIRKAVDGILLHHSDDLRVAQAALNIDYESSPNRLAFTRGLYQKAVSHATKGTAALALAQILMAQAMEIEGYRAEPTQHVERWLTQDEQGRPKTIEGPKRYDDAAWAILMKTDEAAMRREAEELFRLVIEKYADVPPSPTRLADGKPEPRSLADKAKAKLDELKSMTEETPAPEIDGVDLDGKPLKLADYRGKIVALVFWNSDCGDYLAGLANERELLERFKAEPFVILGVNTDAKPEAALKAIKEHNIPWRNNFRDGQKGPIAERYGMGSFPAVVMIDGEGLICVKPNLRFIEGEVVGEVLKQMKEKKEKPAVAK